MSVFCNFVCGKSLETEDFDNVTEKKSKTKCRNSHQITTHRTDTNRSSDTNSNSNTNSNLNSNAIGIANTDSMCKASVDGSAESKTKFDTKEPASLPPLTSSASATTLATISGSPTLSITPEKTPTNGKEWKTQTQSTHFNRLSVSEQLSSTNGSLIVRRFGPQQY